MSLSSMTRSDIYTATYSRRGDVHSAVASLVSQNCQSIMPFKGVVVDTKPVVNQSGIPLIKVRNPRSVVVLCKIATHTGGKNRVHDAGIKEGDVVYCLKALDDDYPVIFAYPNGHSGNRKSERLGPDEEKIVFRTGTYHWYKANGSVNTGIRSNYLLEIAKDFKSTVRGSYSIIAKDYKTSTSGDFNLKIGGKTVVDCGTILLGSDAVTERAILGDMFMQMFNTHTHVGNMGAPTAPPQPSMTDAHLSETVKLGA